jgi:hypothetical protein
VSTQPAERLFAFPKDSNPSSLGRKNLLQQQKHSAVGLFHTMPKKASVLIDAPASDLETQHLSELFEGNINGRDKVSSADLETQHLSELFADGRVCNVPPSSLETEYPTPSLMGFDGHKPRDDNEDIDDIPTEQLSLCLPAPSKNKVVPAPEPQVVHEDPVAVVDQAPPRHFINRPMWLEAVSMEKLTFLEKYFHTRLRQKSFPLASFAFMLLVSTILVASEVLFMTATLSYQEAERVCEIRRESVFPTLSGDQQESNEFGSNTGLFPRIVCELAMLAASLTGLFFWLFGSPHCPAKAAALDRKLGSFFGFNYLGSLFTIAFGNMNICTSSKTMYLTTNLLYLAMCIGIGLVGTNLLCHRYLLERAIIMNNITTNGARSPPGKDQGGWFSLESLQVSFIWEIRTLVVSGIILVVYVVNPRAGLGAGAVICSFILVTDVVFSILITYIFLKPLLEVLETGSGQVVTGSAARRLQRTKRWNFAGVAVAVGSSTVLYLDFIAWSGSNAFVKEYTLHRSSWGNPMTFGLAVDSILNTLGMMLLSGILEGDPLRVLGEWLLKVKRSLRPSNTPRSRSRGSIERK